MNEMGNPLAIRRRLHQGILPLIGNGLDVGAGAPEWRWWEQVPGMHAPQVDQWDRAQGDAHYLAGVPTGQYDWLTASHILEHLGNPELALFNWLRVVRPGGALLIVVPHRALYERQEQLPSRWNPAEHLRYYLPYVEGDRRGCTVGLYQWLTTHRGMGFEIERLVTGDWGCTNTHLTDQHPNGEYQIDALLRRTQTVFDAFPRTEITPR